MEKKPNSKIDLKKAQEELSKRMDSGVFVSNVLDGFGAVDVMFDGPRLCELGYDALDKHKFAEARKHFGEAVELTERALGAECWQLVLSLTGLCEAYIGLADWSNADKTAKRALKLATENNDKENIKIVRDYMKQIDQVETIVFSRPKCILQYCRLLHSI